MILAVFVWIGGFVVQWPELPVPIYIHESVPELPRKNFLYSIDMLNSAWNYHSGKGRLFEVIGTIKTTKYPV